LPPGPVQALSFGGSSPTCRPRPLFLRERRASSAVPSDRPRRSYAYPSPLKENIMGKYLLAWLLGVPGIVLLLVYLFFH